jgi:hypothetical protein
LIDDFILFFVFKGLINNFYNTNMLDFDIVTKGQFMNGKIELLNGKN